MSEESILYREPTQAEMRLLSALAERAVQSLGKNWLDGIRVASLDDGGMGSLKLLPHGCPVSSSRKFGDEVASISFIDRDGVEVIASLYVDGQGRPFELDTWKTDFSKLLQVPERFS